MRAHLRGVVVHACLTLLPSLQNYFERLKTMQILQCRPERVPGLTQDGLQPIRRRLEFCVHEHSKTVGSHRNRLVRKLAILGWAESDPAMRAGTLQPTDIVALVERVKLVQSSLHPGDQFDFRLEIPSSTRWRLFAARPEGRS